MTTVVAHKTSKGVTWGWDSLMVTGNQAEVMVNQKVFVNRGLIYGVAGSLRALDVVQYAEFPHYDEEEELDARKWLITKWVPYVLDNFKDIPGMLTEDGELDGCSILIGTRDEVFAIDGRLSVSHTPSGVHAMGSGGDYAMGAVMAGATVIEALHIAGNFDPYSGGAYTTVTASSYLDSHSIV